MRGRGRRLLLLQVRPVLHASIWAPLGLGEPGLGPSRQGGDKGACLCLSPKRRRALEPTTRTSRDPCAEKRAPGRQHSSGSSLH